MSGGRLAGWRVAGWRVTGGRWAAWLCAAMITALPCAHAEDDGRFPLASMHEEVLSLPGDPSRPVALQVTLFAPPGPGPFPLAVVNHGATNVSATNRGERYRFTILAYYFLSRGYAVALPMMRGFAGSGGTLLGAGCDMAAVAVANARDIRAVTEALARRPGIDGSRTVVAGQSFGAWNTLGVGASPPAGTRALIVFNAAIRSSSCKKQDASMAEGATKLAAHAALPSLWFYGDNDTVMPNASWREIFRRYKSAAPQAELVAFGAYGTDSHQLLSDPLSFPVWAPRLDAFLAQSGLPSKIVYPDYLPYPVPPPTQFAALDAVDAIPVRGAEARTLYRQFLAAPTPRAFVIGPTTMAEQHGGYDPLGRALLACGRAPPGCRPYAVNNDIVWTAQRPVQRAVPTPVRMNSPTSLGTFYAINPDCSTRGLALVTITEPPTHGAAVVAQTEESATFSARSRFAACSGTKVPTVGVTYTPATGYAGEDALAMDVTMPGGQRQTIRLSLKVM